MGMEEAETPTMWHSQGKDWQEIVCIDNSVFWRRMDLVCKLLGGDGGNLCS